MSAYHLTNQNMICGWEAATRSLLCLSLRFIFKGRINANVQSQSQINSIPKSILRIHHHYSRLRWPLRPSPRLFRPPAPGHILYVFLFMRNTHPRPHPSLPPSLLPSPPMDAPFHFYGAPSARPPSSPHPAFMHHSLPHSLARSLPCPVPPSMR